jgi:hypothetical protein
MQRPLDTREQDILNKLLDQCTFDVANLRAQAVRCGLATACLRRRLSDLGIPQARDVRIGVRKPVARQFGQLVELANAIWHSTKKFHARGGPLFNFHSEGQHFGNCDRCLVITSTFYEFTGASYPKTKHWKVLS